MFCCTEPIGWSKRIKNSKGEIQFVCEKCILFPEYAEYVDEGRMTPVVQVKEKQVKRIAVTGHRPNKLYGWEDSKSYNKQKHEEIKAAIREKLESAQEKFGEIELIVGGAQGADWDAARVALSMNIKYHLYKPFEGQEKVWPEAAQKKYHKMEAHAASVTVLNHHTPDTKREVVRALHVRNEHMVDDADFLLAIYDGSETGGTANAVGYAKNRGVSIVYINPKAL